VTRTAAKELEVQSFAAASPADVALVRSIAALFAVANVAHAVMLLRYFAFPVPMLFDALIALGLIAVVIVAT